MHAYSSVTYAVQPLQLELIVHQHVGNVIVSCMAVLLQLFTHFNAEVAKTLVWPISLVAIAYEPDERRKDM